MWRRISLVFVGVIILVTITNVVLAQGDYKNLSRVQMDDWCTKYAPDHDNPPKRGIQLDNVPNQNVNSWGCLGYDGKLYGISISDMCRFYYGSDYADAKYWDYNNPDSWYCNYVNAPAPTAIPPQPTNPPQQQSSGPTPQSQPPSSDVRYPDAQERPNGGVLVPIICRDWGHGWSSQEPGNAYGWRCDDGFLFGASEFSQACRDAWGSARPYATLANWQNKYGWRCASQSGYVDPMPSGGSSGQSSGNSDCPQAPSRLSPGQVAWVSDTDPYDLNIRSVPAKSASVIFTVPIRQTVTIIGSPTCGDGYLWLQISYNGNTGWAAEVNRNGTYNLIPGTYGGGNSGQGGEVWAYVPADTTYLPIPVACGWGGLLQSKSLEWTHAYVQFTVHGQFVYDGLRLRSLTDLGDTIASNSVLLKDWQSGDAHIIRMGVQCRDLWALAPAVQLLLTDPGNWVLDYRKQ